MVNLSISLQQTIGDVVSIQFEANLLNNFRISRSGGLPFEKHLKDSGDRLNRLTSSLGRVASYMNSAAPTRPTVAFQSDDWGRTGLPSMEALDELQSMGLPIGRSAWDYYGLETEHDVTILGDLLSTLRDEDGRSACFTANFVMANAELSAMREEGFKRFLYRPITEGFPHPWTDHLMSSYKHNIDRGVFYPGLHGFTHFNVDALMASMKGELKTGETPRTLASFDIPYLASLTPEYNFALVQRDGEREEFVDVQQQAHWVEKGVEVFSEAFGCRPKTTCAPGYRANQTTLRLWKQHGIEAMQVVGRGDLSECDEILQLKRNVRFEPALDGRRSLEGALSQAEIAVKSGLPIVVCSHSINYVSRFLDRAEESRSLLCEFVQSLQRLFPDLRFASDVDLVEAYYGRREGWLRPPHPKEIYHRINFQRALEVVT